MTAMTFTEQTRWEVRDWEGVPRVALFKAPPHLVMQVTVAFMQATGETLTIWADGSLVANLGRASFECHRDHEALFAAPPR